MVMSATGYIVCSSYNTLYGRSLSGDHLAIVKSLIFSVTPRIHDVMFGARSRAWRRFKKQAKAYKEANPQMCVRIIAFNRTRVMYTYNSRCHPWEDKKQ
ncbi:phosphate starvation-inducible protein PhoH [Salmonella enterica subsp. arizonae serovar 41:z4,z23:-]|uniref:Protein phoH n=1 Tax=Salmonella enterica subsp. arizonae TaxID=59203 RepID=A0A379S6E7_SALER|nr:phosphate starvation-inducible protein PhoH [Salmonella enterica]OSE60956.1 phosphate starvation-inducible protein PhoH [Salmonella enterica subsp. arizonae serovar 41:z4,z23:-]SUG15769.1 protein phoH [Salmonella enterica subsp. arizonae]EAR7756022.1 phosphate starvation-inducible protein PhoH [Salmonella enterica]EAS8742861.1 phosphate starvation-inducible protein PhoH [Salmonella enterica]